MGGRITGAAAAGLGVAVVGFAIGLGFDRLDAAVIGMVLLVAVGSALLRPAPAEAEVDVVELDPRDEAPTGPSDTRIRITVHASDAESIRVSLTALGFQTIPLAVAPGTTLDVRLPVAHTGAQELIAVSAQAVAADASRVGAPSPTRTLLARIPPRALPVPFLPLPRTLGGRTGNHDSRRPGAGGEFHDVHPFAPGDRMRRIDWRATARLARAPGDLYVRRTLATADADVALVIDDRDDLSGAPATWSIGDRSLRGATSLDLAREAAWSLATAYLDAGDQVALQALSRPARDVLCGSGTRQRHALRTAITAVAGGSPSSRVGAPRVPRGALVVLLSTLLDDVAAGLVLRWRGAGHRVIVIDTLPQLPTERIRHEALVAERIVLAEREDRIRSLAAVGAELLRWDAPGGERTATLRTLTRMRRR